MTNNVYQILDDMKEFLVEGPFTNTVSFGDISDVDLDKNTIFPLTHINIANAVIKDSTIEFDINILAIDILDDNSLENDEFGATTGKPRVTGPIDLPHLAHLVKSETPNISVSCLDRFDGLETILAVESYVYTGKGY